MCQTNTPPTLAAVLFIYLLFFFQLKGT